MPSRFHLTPARLVFLLSVTLAVVLWWWVWPMGRAYHLAYTGTWPEKKHSVRELDCLYDVLSNRPIAETGPAVVRCLVEHRPLSYYNGRKGEHSWRSSRISKHQRVYYVAQELWRDANSQPSRQALVSALPGLLRSAETSPHRRLVIQTLIHTWNPEAKPDLIRISSDLREDIETQAAAVSALMRNDDLHIHIPGAIEIIQRGATAKFAKRPLSVELSPIQGRLHLFHAMLFEVQIKRLQPDDRAQLVQVGMSLLRELPETNLRDGYSVALLLGRMVNAPNDFTPNRGEYQINKRDGVIKETFYTDTVKNALAWQQPNTLPTRLP